MGRLRRWPHERAAQGCGVSHPCALVPAGAVRPIQTQLVPRSHPCNPASWVLLTRSRLSGWPWCASLPSASRSAPPVGAAAARCGAPHTQPAGRPHLMVHPPCCRPHWHAPPRSTSRARRSPPTPRWTSTPRLCGCCATFSCSSRAAVAGASAQVSGRRAAPVHRRHRRCVAHCRACVAFHKHTTHRHHVAAGAPLPLTCPQVRTWRRCWGTCAAAAAAAALTRTTVTR